MLMAAAVIDRESRCFQRHRSRRLEQRAVRTDSTLRYGIRNSRMSGLANRDPSSYGNCATRPYLHLPLNSMHRPQCGSTSAIDLTIFKAVQLCSRALDVPFRPDLTRLLRRLGIRRLLSSGLRLKVQPLH